MTSPRILLMAGGTGGHIFPALAVAQWLQNRGWGASWLGSMGGMEEQVVPKYDIELNSISVAGVRGKSIITRLMAPFMLLRAVWEAATVIRKIKPDVVLGMGGFASGPGGLASWLLGYPLCIHEQNAIAGMTNKYLSKFARYRLEAFEGSLPDATAEVGNPVRAEIAAIEAPESRIKSHQGPLRILVVGGSRGAAVLNEVLPETIAHLHSQLPITIWHQAGKGNQGVVSERYSQAFANQETTMPEGIQISEFIDDMPAAYGWADLVVCRSGALTVSELASAGIGSILIPFPHAVDDHQTANANYLVKAGAATLLPQADLSVATLSEAILSASQSDTCLEMAISARHKARNDATETVANYCAKAAGIELTGTAL